MCDTIDPTMPVSRWRQLADTVTFAIALDTVLSNTAVLADDDLVARLRAHRSAAQRRIAELRGTVI